MKFVFFALSLVLLVTSFTKATVFNSPRNFPRPTTQYAIAAGDLNNDGIPDLISGGLPGTPAFAKIFVSLGLGNGSFDVPQLYVIGISDDETLFPAQRVERIMVSDMNNDGNQDVVVSHNRTSDFSNQSRTFITILLGNGQGNFTSNTSYVFHVPLSAAYTTAFDLVDLNKDGNMDVVLALNSGGSVSCVSLLQNMGNGNFQAQGGQVIGGQMFDVAGGNFNNDSYPDLVMATTRGIVMGLGGGQTYPTKFIFFQPLTFFRGLVTGDFNSDGLTDFITYANQGLELQIYMNSAGGFPETPAVYEIGEFVAALQTTDFNFDGTIDLILVSGGSIKILIGNGDGTFTPLSTNALVTTSGKLAVADFDNNGKMDFGTVSGGDAIVLLSAPNTDRYYTDVDGDRKSDFTVYRPGTGTWWSLFGNNSLRSIQFGAESDRIVPGNYDGDNKADIAVFRDGVWYVLRSSDNSVLIEQWGAPGDIPLPADYDNDGKMNLAVFRPLNGVWWIKNETGSDAFQWGVSTDKPVPADYDGDGKTDLAVFRPENGTWYVLNSRDSNITYQQFGLTGDVPVHADYDGDGKADFAVYRNGGWYLLQSDLGFSAFQFGINTDIPVPADFDGDGKTDPAVYRNGTWYLRQSTNGFQATQFGLSGDSPSSILH